MKKIFVSILALIIITSLVVGCSKTEEADKGTPPVKDSDIVIDGNDKETSKPSDSNGSKDEVGAKLSKTYSEMMKNKKYLMKYKVIIDVEGKKMESIITTAVSGDKQAVTSKVDGMENTMIFMDDKVYMIDDAKKMVIEMPSEIEIEGVENEEIETDGMEYVGTGKEDGLVYENYATDDGNIKYYFDGDKLVKIVFTDDGVDQVMEVIEMSDKVTESMFEIPADYEKMQIPGIN